MKRLRIPSSLPNALTVLALCCLFAGGASAHPGSGIVVTKHGEVFFTDTGRGVGRIDSNGTLTFIPSSKFHWMTIDEEGRFSASSNSLGEWFERVTPGSSKAVLILCSEFPLAVNRDGDILYAYTRHGQAKIVKKTPRGEESVIARDEIYRDISGIASGPDGSVYLTDAGSADSTVIRKIAADGTVSRIGAGITGQKGMSDGPPASRPSYCRGLDVDSLGNVFVACTGSRRVLKISPTGGWSTILRADGNWAPTGVALHNGELYVLEWKDAPPTQTEVRLAWTPRVRKVGRDGTVTTLATVSR
jgi:hypothetical protein